MTLPIPGNDVLTDLENVVPVALSSDLTLLHLGEMLTWYRCWADGWSPVPVAVFDRPVETCLLLPGAQELVVVNEGESGVHVECLDATTGSLIRMTTVALDPQHAWIDLVLGNINGVEVPLLLLESPEGLGLVEPFSGRMTKWPDTGDDTGEVILFAAEGPQSWRWERFHGPRPTFRCHPGEGKSWPVPGTLLATQGSLGLCAIPSSDGSIAMLVDARAGGRDSARIETSGEVVDGALLPDGTTLLVVNRGLRHHLLRWAPGRSVPIKPIGDFAALTMVGTDGSVVFLREESLLTGVRFITVGEDGVNFFPTPIGHAGSNPRLVELDGGRSWAWLPPDSDPTAALRVVVSCHGGPESCEYDGLRYSGLYRRLLSDGIAVVVWNYPGGTGFGTRWRGEPYGRWGGAFSQNLSSILAELPTEKLTYCFLGVSFGAWVALQAASTPQLPKPAGAVLLSPMVDLERHRDRIRSMPGLNSFTHFFDTLFGSPDQGGYLCSEELLAAAPPLRVLYSQRDEVINAGHIADFCRRAGEAGVDVDMVETTAEGHVPADPEDAHQRFNQAHEWVRELLL